MSTFYYRAEQFLKTDMDAAWNFFSSAKNLAVITPPELDFKILTDLDGKEITSNEKVSSELEIDITNGQNIPTDEKQMNDLGKQIAVVVKQALQDKSEYNTYNVLFVTKKEDAGVTQRTWKGKVFKSEEL